MPLGRQTLRRLGRTIRNFATSEVGGRAVLGDDALGREHFDTIVEIAPDGTWTRTATQVSA